MVPFSCMPECPYMYNVCERNKPRSTCTYEVLGYLYKFFHSFIKLSCDNKWHNLYIHPCARQTTQNPEYSVVLIISTTARSKLCSCEEF